MDKLGTLCLDCGKEVSKKAKRCGKCNGKKHSLRILGKNNPSYKHGKTNQKNYCVDCQKEITSFSTRCRSCTNRYLFKVGILYFSGKNHPNYKNGRAVLDNYCIDCSKPLSKTSCYYNRKRCQSCAMKELFKNPENHPNYINGDSIKYPREFNNELKEQIRKRDNYTCQNCEMTEEEHLIVLGSNLSCHHIDYDKMNSNKYNLITLCLWCHLRSNINRIYWKEHYINKVKCMEKGIKNG